MTRGGFASRKKRLTTITATRKIGATNKMHSRGEMNLVETSIQKPAQRMVLAKEPDDVDRVWLLSVRHSGTHYMYKYLEMLGYQQCMVFWETMTQKNTTTQKQFIHAHFEVGHEYQRCMTDEKCVIPMRNPIEVFKSHCYRYRWELDEYVPYILNAYERLKYVACHYNVHIFQVDAPDQIAEVESLGSFFNSHSWTYKEQAKDIATTRTRHVSIHEGFTPTQVKLFNQPPKEIVDLAHQYGY